MTDNQIMTPARFYSVAIVQDDSDDATIVVHNRKSAIALNNIDMTERFFGDLIGDQRWDATDRALWCGLREMARIAWQTIEQLAETRQ